MEFVSARLTLLRRFAPRNDRQPKDPRKNGAATRAVRRRGRTSKAAEAYPEGTSSKLRAEDKAGELRSRPLPEIFELPAKVRYNPASMVQIVEKIDKAVESKSRCTLLDKMGRCFHGTLTDSWVRISGGKLRGKIQFTSDEKGAFELDANDILDLRLETK